METGARSARNELFQELKPCCVELSQLALRDDGSTRNSKALIESTKKLLDILQRKCQRDDGAFDEKLADYVFFPLSQILRRKQRYTDTLSELTIKCLKILLEYGWRKSIALDLAKQLLILLTFVAGGVPGQTSEPVPEELAIEAYGALGFLFRDLSVTPGGASSLVETATIPALGHCVTVILDAITDGSSAGVQIQALQALSSVWRCIKDPQALSTFLPGTISGLTKCLMPTTANRRSRKTIVTALEVLELLLVSILSDIRTRNIRSAGDNPSEDPSGPTEQTTLTKQWLKATTGQIKLALSNVIRLRTHDSAEVRGGLNKFCLTILDECHDTLAESSPMLVETCMTVSEVKVENDFSRTTSLIDLASIHPDIGEMIKGTVYNWATSLPRIMQSSDETAKHVILGQLSKAHELLTSLNLDSSILEDTLNNSLRDSVTVTLEPLSTKLLQEADFSISSQAAMTLVPDNAQVANFQPIVMPHESQRQTRTDLASLLDSFGTRESQIRMASEMLEYVRGASGPSLLSAYWLASQLLRSATSRNKDLDEFFTSSLTFSDEQEVVNQELLSYSVSILSNPEEYTDWRLEAVALEVIASTAQHLKQEFRTELVDTLYPITQLLGSPNSQLRSHAVTCLNIISTSCGYASSSALIIDNVDYMVNAISLRLNTFDISPQAPQVLVMMIRLTGPSLLLYLDDVVGSIFAALDNFHGYHKLVEVLFSVLGEIVDVGSKSGQLLLTSSPSSSTTINHRKTGPPIPKLSDILAALTKKPPSSPEEEDPLPKEPVPQMPWKEASGKSASTLLDEAASPREDQEEDLPSEIAKCPPTKIYSTLSRIARLGQHYLTNPSPVLRAKLLSLISTSCVALHGDEDEFLPLVNDIWPVVLARLWDEEAFVSIAAMETVGEMCRCCGDFLATRMQAEWSNIMRLGRQSKIKVQQERKGNAGRGRFAEAEKVWEGVIGLLVAIVGYVRVGDEMFDDILEILREELVKGREGVRDALEGVNADAVWLVMQFAGKNGGIEMPVVEGYTFAPLA